MDDLLTKKNVKHVWNESGGGHSWPNWQVYLSKYAPLLFRDATLDEHSFMTTIVTPRKDLKMTRSAFISTALLLGALALHAQTPATLSIEVNQTKSAVSPTLYGLMTEEINYSYDGGLYAELVRNRTFRSDWSGILNWFLVEKGASAAKIGVDSKEGPSAALTNSAKLEVTKADANSPAGLINEGYWGIAVRPNTRYTGSLFAKTDSEAHFP